MSENNTSDINIQCPVPNCSYETGTFPQMVAVTLLSTHATVHSAPSLPKPTQHGPKLQRPQIDIGVSAEEWKLFESRWKLFQKSSDIASQDRAIQLFQCASEQLGDAILRLNNDVSEKSEDELLATMKSLAVIPVATMVLRAELFAMKQNRDEAFRAFFARVRGKADICSYMLQHKCQCGRANEVNFTEIMIRDVVIAGIYDEDIIGTKVSATNQQMTLFPWSRPKKWRVTRSLRFTIQRLSLTVRNPRSLK